MSASVIDPTTKSEVTITKDDIVYHYKQMFKNEFIRRMAESCSTKIGKYAESQNLPGDLSRKINTSLMKKKSRLIKS
jgi:hypothetical protein